MEQLDFESTWIPTLVNIWKTLRPIFMSWLLSGH